MYVCMCINIYIYVYDTCKEKEREREWKPEIDDKVGNLEVAISRSCTTAWTKCSIMFYLVRGS